MRKLIAAAAVMLPVAFLAACEDDEGPEVETFTTALTGAAEVPPVTTTATGTVTLIVTGNQLEYIINVTDIDAANAAHIHQGDPGENGDVMVSLFNGPTTAADFSGVLVDDAITIVDSVITHLRNGTAYVNVHTDANPAGEIRGQVP